MKTVLHATVEKSKNLVGFSLFASMEDRVAALAATLADNSEDWKPRLHALETLGEIAEACRGDPDALTKEVFAALRVPMKQQLTDLRSQIVRAACRVTTQLAVVAGHRSRDFLSYVMPQLISMSAGANKVMAGFALECARDVVAAVQVHKAVAPLCELCTVSRNKAIVESAIECILVALSSWDTFRRNDVDVVASAVETSLGAASSKARATARDCYWALERLYPERAERMFRRLDGRTQNLVTKAEPSGADSPRRSSAGSAASVSSSPKRGGGGGGRQGGGGRRRRSGDISDEEDEERAENGKRRNSVEDMSATMIQAMMRGAKGRGDGGGGSGSGSGGGRSADGVEDDGHDDPASAGPTISPRASSSGMQAPLRSPRSPGYTRDDCPYSPGDAVLVTEQRLPALVRFVGGTSFSSGLWIGCELTRADDVGKNSGQVRGVTYFECAANKGLFVRVGNLTRDPSGGGGEEDEEGEDQVDDAADEEDTPAAPVAAPPAAMSPPASPGAVDNGGDDTTATVASQLLNAHRAHVDDVLECLREEMVKLAEFEAQGDVGAHRVAEYASCIAESMHKREQMLEAMYQRLGTLCATLAQ